MLASVTTNFTWFVDESVDVVSVRIKTSISMSNVFSAPGTQCGALRALSQRRKQSFCDEERCSFNRFSHHSDRSMRRCDCGNFNILFKEALFRDVMHQQKDPQDRTCWKIRIKQDAL